jgi:hypothetical protein
MGPDGSGFPGALGACALAEIMAANRVIAKKIRWNKQESPHIHGGYGRFESPPTGADKF